MKFSLEQFKDLTGQIQLFKNYYSRLTEREQTIVLAMGGGGIVFLMFLIYTTFWGLTVRMGNRIEAGRQSLSHMSEMQTQFERTQKLVNKMESMIQRTPPDFHLLSHLEKLAQKSGVKIDNAKETPVPNSNELYRESQVAITVSKITLRTLINLLYDIENGDYLMRISSLKVKPDYQDPTQLNVNFVVSTFQSAGK